MKRHVDRRENHDPDEIISRWDEIGGVQLPSEEYGDETEEPGQVSHGPVGPVEDPALGGARVGSGQGHQGLEEGQDEGQHPEHRVGVLSGKSVVSLRDLHTEYVFIACILSLP